MFSSVCETNPLNGAALLDGFCAGELPLSRSIDRPRSIVAVGAADFLTLERGTGSVLLGEDLDGDGIPETVRTLAQASGLNHGLAVTATHLYASSDTAVYRWPYDPATKTVSDAPPQVVIENIDASGRHVTRTLAIDPAAAATNTNTILYVSVGSADNVDADSSRSRIRCFDLQDEMQFPLDFQTGIVFADGLRNEVAMEFRPQDNVLWGAGNGPDSLVRSDLGGPDMFNDNPAEEVHRFDMSSTNSAQPPQNYGYPYCFREYELGSSGLGRGTAWAWPSFLDDGTVTDRQCRDVDTYDVPVLAMQAHSAPLGMAFYQYSDNRPAACDGVEPFPESMDGDAFIAFHGSWNRATPTGYKVVHVPITADGTGVEGGIGADPVDLLQSAGDGAKWSDGFRPVDVSFDACGRLLVSSDGSRGVLNVEGAKIVRIERGTQRGSTDPGFSLFGWVRQLLEGLFSWIQALFNWIFGS